MEAANGIRDSKVRDKINYSSRMLRMGAPQSSQEPMENSIGSNLDSLRNTLSQAASALGRPSQAKGMNQALDKARQRARGVDSLEQGMRERQQQAQQGRQGQQNQNGEQAPTDRGGQVGPAG